MIQTSNTESLLHAVPASWFKTSAASIKGTRNNENQDNFMMLSERGVFAVCDGMGGHKGGQFASQLIINNIFNTLEVDKIEDINISYLTYLIQYANRVVYQHAFENLELRGMGSTLVLVWIIQDRLEIFHVGDSRAYRLRDNHLTCLTQDHSSTHGKGISRAIGAKNRVVVEHHSWDWQVDDYLLLLSDGISDVIPDIKLTSLLVETTGPMVIKISQLINEAIIAGGDDDKTAMLIQVHP
ncbi:MAG: serine/threonine-protein phosphatase [Methylococcales bacterium]|nr:serine/threonine-protein phosphatase [Methylococcales bacterium]